jgi:hypothetical protein
MKPYLPSNTFARKLDNWACWVGAVLLTVKWQLERHPKLYPLAFLMEFIVGLVAIWFFALLALGLLFLVLTWQPVWAGW